MNEYVYVPIELNTYRELIRKHPDTPNSTIQSVVDDFLERTSEDDQPYQSRTGFSWNPILLPNGTKLRTKYFGDYLVAEIVDEKIIWRDEEYSSVSQVINNMRGGTSNNAWKVTEVKRPGDTNWVYAERLR